jgi:hypothetical protein
MSSISPEGQPNDKYFTTGDSLDLDTFLSLYREINLLSSLLTLSLGLDDKLVMAMSEKYLFEEYSSIYTQWEEVVDS